jgi:hypothetical protein
LVPRSSGTPVATWARPTLVVSRRRVLEAAFVLSEFRSPSRRIFIGSHSLPPLWFAVSVLHSSRGSSHRSSSTTPPRAGSSSTTAPPPCVRVPRHITRLVTLLVVDYCASAEHPGSAARRAARHAARRRLLCLAQARRRLLRLRRASGCLGTPRGSSRGSSSTTSSTPRVRLLRHIAWHVARLISPLVVDYFTYSARPGASTHRAARHAARCATRRRLLRLAQARRRLLRLRRASGCLGTSRGSSRGSSRRSSPTNPPRTGSSSTTSPPPRVRVPRHVARLVMRHVARLIIHYSASRRLVVDYFVYAERPGASARRAARRQLLHLRRVAGCLGTSRGSLRRSSLTTSLMSCVRVPRHVAGPVTRLIVDYSVRHDFVLRPRWLYFSHAMRRDYLSRGNTGFTSSTPHATTMLSSGRIASTIHVD